MRNVAHGYSLMVRPGFRDVSCAYKAEEGVFDVRIRIQKSSDARAYVNGFFAIRPFELDGPNPDTPHSNKNRSKVFLNLSPGIAY